MPRTPSSEDGYGIGSGRFPQDGKGAFRATGEGSRQVFVAYAGWQAVYVNDIGDRSEAVAARTYDYARYMNTQTVPEIVRAATAYRNAISSAANAHD